ncbi:MAG: DNRLRE domain-containing protein, partial [Chrysiogenales bacterium]
MLGKMTYLICFALLLGAASSVQALITVTTEDGNGADAYLTNDSQQSPNTNTGAEVRMRAFRQLADTRSKTGYIRFDLGDAAGDMSGATLTFEATFLKSSAKTVEVYGLIDGDGDSWDESTVTYNTAPGVLPTTLGNYALDTANVTLLGTITTPAAGDPYPVRFSSNPADLPLTSFLDSDTNTLVTFIFIGTNNEGEIASKEHETFIAPTLTLPNAVVGVKTSAINPNPVDEAEYVSRDAVLSWSPGGYAEKNDVYLGKNFDDVNSASTTVDPAGVYKGRQDPNQFPAIGTVRLETGETYYWRIDGIGAAPGNEIYRGKVWQFIVEPYAFPIDGQMITATASGQAENQGPENTVNGSGLVDNLHSTILEDMWLTAVGEPAPAWIQYDFDKTYKLHEMLIWNFNGQAFLIAAGLKDVVVEYSSDGTSWMQIDSVNEFARASGLDVYASNTTVAFEGIPVKSVKITANSNWSGGLADQFGLSEVRFFYVPVQARDPKSGPGQTDVPLDVTLGWTAGREAAGHNVYLSTSEQAVIDGTAFVDAVTEAGYVPLSLNYATTYYWRVDEVNDLEDPAVVEGDIWSFRTKEFLVIEDFELYDSNDNQIWYAWKDGLGYGKPDVPPYDPGNGTGAAVGDENTDSFTEETIVHEGRQSM